jgi:hypothetical protein
MKNGGALSSRNLLLSNYALLVVGKVYRFLKLYKKHGGGLLFVKSELGKIGVKKIDYIKLINLLNFKEVKKVNSNTNIFIAYYLNGAGTTNLGDRSNLVYVPQEAVEELQVQVGGYDAEISGANSGVIKRTLKQGTSEYSGSFSLQNDGAGSGEGSFGDGYSYGHQTVLASVGGPLLPGSESLKFFGAVESSKEEDSFVKIANGFEFLDQQDERTDNSAYVDQFDLSWKDGTSPGRQDEYLNFTGSLSYDGGPLRANVGIVNNSGTTNNGGGIMSQLQWGGAMVNTQNDTGAFLNSFDVSPRFRTNEYANNMLVAELTYALSNNTILRANASSFKNE